MPRAGVLRTPRDGGAALQVPFRQPAQPWVTGARHSRAELHAAYCGTEVILAVERKAEEK